MNSEPLSLWDQAQLISIRLLTRVLGIVDRLLNVHWGERLLERMAGRWQSQLGELDEALARLERERAQLQLQAQALALHAAAVYLGGRQLARDELRFDPADPHDEEILDASIDLLVKERLASIEMEQTAKDHYIYHLEPDWAAIRARLADAAARSEPEVAGWLQETITFIDSVAINS
jgi:hypothetical protein